MSRTSRERLTGLAGVRDDDLLDRLAAAERRARLLDAERVLLAAEVAERSRPELGVDGLAQRRGFRRPKDLIEAVTLVSGRTIVDRIRLGALVRERQSLDGRLLEPLFPGIAAALIDGSIGVDTADAITKPLSEVTGGPAMNGVREAERALLGVATGTSEHSAAAALPADHVGIQARVWCAWVDPDGLEPSYEDVVRSRRFTGGRRMGPLTRYTLDVPTEQAAVIEDFFSAHLSPQTSSTSFLAEEDFARQKEEQALDGRSRDQKRADILLGIVGSAARDESAPRIGGARPTPIITVRLRDLTEGRGAGFIDGQDDPVPLSVVRQAICTGGYQLALLGERGEILQLGTRKRLFSAAQRRAIAARDGGCIVCGTRASMTQIHHVTGWQPAEAGTPRGPTNVGNGTMLCWAHHRDADTGRIRIRMTDGIPEIHQPGRGWVPGRRARTGTLDAIDHLGDPNAAGRQPAA